MEDEKIVLTDEEKDLLTLGPKLCVRNRLCETDLEVCMTDLEVCIMKYGWEVMGESEEEKNLAQRCHSAKKGGRSKHFWPKSEQIRDNLV